MGVAFMIDDEGTVEILPGDEAVEMEYDEVCRCGPICGCYAAGDDWPDDYEDTATRDADWAAEDNAWTAP